MPQLILEYSKNIADPVDFKALFLECHKIIEKVGSIRIENCKSRAVKRDLFLIGDGTNTKNAFIHVDLSFAAERSLEIKQQIGQEILKTLAKHFSKSLAVLNLQITVKVTSIDKKTYFKIPEGTFSPPL